MGKMLNSLSDFVAASLAIAGAIYFLYIILTGNHLPNDAWYMSCAAFWLAYNCWARLTRPEKPTLKVGTYDKP